MEYCIWKCGEWCIIHDLPHRIEEYGSPDLQFTLPFHLPYEVEQALIGILVPEIIKNI